MLSALLVGYDLTRTSETDAAAATPGTARAPAIEATPASPGAEAPATSPGAEAPAGAAASAPVAVLAEGPGTFSYATTEGRVAGTAGDIRRYRVAVEDGTGITADTFGAAVEGIVADPRSWIAGQDVRLQRVPGTAPAEFTVYLATPATSEKMCREEWMETERYTSCRLSDGRVVINLARWLTGVAYYGAPLSAYQTYAINHEVGHQLGHGHELCPSPGQPAPVMQQQTLGLQGCVANAWPYVNGARYQGPPTSDL